MQHGYTVCYMRTLCNVIYVIIFMCIQAVLCVIWLHTGCVVCTLLYKPPNHTGCVVCYTAAYRLCGVYTAIQTSQSFSKCSLLITKSWIAGRTADGS